MRDLNSYGQKIVKRICKARKDNNIIDLCLAKIIDEELDSIALCWGGEENTALDLYYRKGADQYQKFFNLIDIISLIQHLENNGLIFIYPMSGAHDRKLYNSKKYEYNEEEDMFVSIEDRGNVVLTKSGEFIINFGVLNISKDEYHIDIISLLDKYVWSIIQPTEELILYVERNFKTNEQVRFEKQQKLTKRSICISIVIGIASILFSALSLLKPMRINKVQYSNIIETISTSINNNKPLRTPNE